MALFSKIHAMEQGKTRYFVFDTFNLICHTQSKGFAEERYSAPFFHEPFLHLLERRDPYLRIRISLCLEEKCVQFRVVHMAPVG
jgi:hypothetical protein